MAGSIEVCLVDGVGRPRLVEMPAGEPLPSFIGHARAHVRSGPDRLARFSSSGEVDDDGRVLYRLDGTHAAVRIEYLRKSPIVPFNQPRIEQ